MGIFSKIIVDRLNNYKSHKAVVWDDRDVARFNATIKSLALQKK